ncbi:MAG: hypothetical protein ACOYLS_09670 [Polymorphobacter sp.]
MDMTLNPPLRLKLRTARILSVAVLAGLGIGYLGGAMFPDDDGGVWLGFSALRLIGLFSAVLLFVDVRNQQAHAPDTMLDERQRAERDSAYVRAHQYIVGSLFIALFYTVPAQAFGWWLPDRDGIIDLVSAFAITSMAVPGMILAWRERSDEG